MRALLILFAILALALSTDAFAQRTFPTVESPGGYGGGLMVFGGNQGSGGGPTPCTGQGQLDFNSNCTLIYAGH